MSDSVLLLVEKLGLVNISCLSTLFIICSYKLLGLNWYFPSILAAKNLGDEAYNNFLDHTFLGDRRTTIREYLTGYGSGIMEEEPPESLKFRYGGWYCWTKITAKLIRILESFERYNLNILFLCCACKQIIYIYPNRPWTILLKKFIFSVVRAQNLAASMNVSTFVLEGV